MVGGCCKLRNGSEVAFHSPKTKKEYSTTIYPIRYVGALSVFVTKPKGREPQKNKKFKFQMYVV